jgi:hypothetical protein
MDSWNLDLAGPTKSTLTVGAYENAQRFPFQPTGVPGLDFSGAGRGCNTSTGRFDVLQAAYAADGSVRKFSADFEQHCEGAVPALFGWLVINTPLRQVSVSDAMIVGSNAMFMVTLNTPSSTATATVDFTTADGTAIAGTDYVATSQTVTFAPGESAHVVTVPLLTSGGGKKEFFGRLSSPTRTPVWISQGSAKF